MQGDTPSWATYLLPFGGLLFVIFFALERLYPWARVPDEAALSPTGHGWRRIGRNLGLWAFNSGIISPLIVIPVTLWASTMALDWRGGWLPDGGSSAWGVLIDILLLDLWIYWWHRLNHEVPFLWRFHEVHHLDRFLDTTSAVRFHWGEIILSALVRSIAIILLGIHQTSILVFGIVVIAASIFHHANIGLPYRIDRVLSAVIVTPSIHWVHHHRKRGDTDSNYAAIFSWWDRLFGSRSATTRTRDMAIGTQGLEEKNLKQLLIGPLRLAMSRRS